jgi:hypothetical protein
MFGVFRSVLPILILVLMLISVVVYVKIQAQRIDELRMTANLLVLSNEKMADDVKSIVAAQMLANQAIERARLAATQAANGVQAQDFSKVPPDKLQIDLNKATRDVFDDLQAATSTP